jgi:hypothetical protein
VDEIRVCQDGTGDHDTIQAAVYAAPVEGAVVEICPGTYYEAVTIGDRVIEIVGETGDPEDVVIDASGLGRAVYVEGGSDTGSYTFDGLSFIGMSSAVTAYIAGYIEMAHVIIRDSPGPGSVITLTGRLVLRDCEVRDSGGDPSVVGGPLVYLDAYEGSYMRRCHLHNNAGYRILYAPDVAVSNNILSSNDAGSRLVQVDTHGTAGSSLFFNNTLSENVVDAGPVLQVTADEGWYPDHHNFRNNIFVDNVAPDVILYDAAAWGSCGTCDHNDDGACSAAEALAYCTTPILEYNYFQESESGLCTNTWCSAVLTASNQYSVTLGLSDTSDPPYGLPAGSPAIDGGDPALEYDDVDGSVNDPGRYGGPDAYE